MAGTATSSSTTSPAAAMAKSERLLPEMPDQGAPDHHYRDWLTHATGCPPGTSFGDFTRHGPDLTDPCQFTLRGPDGAAATFKTTQNRLANPATTRTTLATATHGVLRPLRLSRGEFEDVWIAMVTLGNIVDTMTDADEARSWLQQYQRVCDPIHGYTMLPHGRFDALLFLTGRGAWGKRQAQIAEEVPPGQRASWLLDAETGETYVRISQLLAFLRHGIGAGPISNATLTARMHEIDVQRLFYEVRTGGLHPKATLFSIPPEPKADS